MIYYGDMKDLIKDCVNRPLVVTRTSASLAFVTATAAVSVVVAITVLEARMVVILAVMLVMQMVLMVYLWGLCGYLYRQMLH